MLIIHFSLTPLAGSPVRICKALNLIDGIESRLVLYDPKGAIDRAHPTDLIWGVDNEEIKALVERADMLHLHNYVNFRTEEFLPIDFKTLWDQGKPMVRQFHSTTELVARMTGQTPAEVLACPIPKLSIAQYPERFYPNAKLVPNIVFPDQYGIKPKRRVGPLRICYSPSNFRASRASRWDTKGYPETIKALNRFSNMAQRQGLEFEIDIIEQVSHEECLRRKADSDIAIDDLVTGSYHMSTLESLALGSLVLSFVDDRVQKAASIVSGRHDFPVVNVRLEDMEYVLLALLRSPDTVREVGYFSGEWMRKHWSPSEMAQRFIEIYKQVIDEPRMPFDNRFTLSTPAGSFLNQEIHDLCWSARHKRWPAEMSPVLKKIRQVVSGLVRKG